MADSDRARVLSIRYKAVSSVLWRVLFLNVAVAAAKIAFGYFTGAVSILSDGFHSLTDGASNVVALVGVSAARRPPDDNHPYGHRKYETMASLAILLFMIFVVVEIAGRAVERLRLAKAPDDLPAGLAVMFATLAVNMFVVRYESRESVQLRSEILGVDAKHTRSDVWTSTAVVAALAGAWLGYPVLDPLAGIVVAVFIGHACWQIVKEASGTLSDRIVIAEDEIRAVVESVPGVVGCEKIRTRGSSDYVFVDLHVWIDAQTPLAKAHAISHVVKDSLMERFPEVADVVIHIEPPHEEAQVQGSSLRPLAP